MLSVIISTKFKEHPYISVPKELQLLLETETEIPYINGCGASSGVSKGIGPTDIDRICILAACFLHDYRYYVGQTMADKYAADLEFLMNMNLILMNHPNTLIVDVEERQLRFEQAMTLFRFVHEYGLKAFVAGKNISAPKKPFVEQMLLSTHITFQTCMIPFHIFNRAIRSKLGKL